MSRIVTPAIESATGVSADIYVRVKKVSGGRVLRRVGLPCTRVFGCGARHAGHTNAGSLSRQEHEIIKLLIREKTSYDVCVVAHGVVGELVGLPVDALLAIRAGPPTGDAKA
ncbi:hypothetical protein VSR68_14790 [Paraburkholderia phymatum]|uniref:hypothetical protein n=1 Tax=Paraburkholderia phymatum TaxID=148447 RepID=UPI0031794492